MLKPLNKINTFLLLVNIVMVSVFFVQNAECGLRGDVTGTYNVENRFIKAKADGRLPQEVLGTCAHEVGHYVWYEYLSDTERSEYESIYNDSSVAISVYAVTGGVEEDFAETFQEYVAFRVDPRFVPEDRQAFFEGPVSEAWHGIRTMREYGAEGHEKNR